MPHDPPLPAEDQIRIQHMIDAADRVIRFAKSTSLEKLSIDDPLTLGIIKSIEVIGEASTRISNATKSRIVEINWQGMRRMRNRMIHGYNTINLEVVWNTVNTVIPHLLLVLRQWQSSSPNIIDDDRPRT